MCVEYFNQQLGAAHPKRWLKYTFLTLLTTKSKKGQKSKKLAAKFSKKNCFFKFAPKRWSNVLFPKNPGTLVFSHYTTARRW